MVIVLRSKIDTVTLRCNIAIVRLQNAVWFYKLFALINIIILCHEGRFWFWGLTNAVILKQVVLFL